jgi:hypothetical protein
LGSIPVAPSIADRIAFWTKAHERLDRLANRIGPDMAKIMGALHENVPMVTPDEQRELQLENARADERFYGQIADMHVGTAEDHKGLLAAAESTIARSQAAAAEAAGKAAQAKERIARIERGEAVDGGLGRPMTYDDMASILKKAGWSDADIKHCEDMGELLKMAERCGGAEASEKIFTQISEAAVAAMRRAERTTSRQMLKGWRAILDNAATKAVTDAEAEGDS